MTNGAPKPSSVNRVDLLQEKLQQLVESQLTNDIVIPLFKSFGYQDVTYSGGLTEEGKDIIGWGLDELNDITLIVGQVKRYKPTSRAADPHSFSEIVTQLSQAIEKEVPHSNGQRYLPNKVFFISPYRVDCKALQSRFEGLKSIRHRVSIIDGQKLASLMLEYLPAEAARLLGPQFEIGSAMIPELSNRALLSALHYGQQKDLKQIYTDIDFFLGKISTRFFFGSDFRPKIVSELLEVDQWHELNRLSSISLSEMNVNILTSSPEQIEQQYTRDRVNYERYRESLNAIELELSGAQAKCEETRGMLDREQRKLLKGSVKLRLAHDQLKKLYVERSECASNGEKSRREKEGIGRNQDVLTNKIRALERKIKTIEIPLHPIRRELESGEAAVRRLFQKRIEALNTCPAPVRYMVSLDGKPLADYLMSRRGMIGKTIARFNRKAPKKNELRAFLESCENIFRVTGLLLSNSMVASAVSIRPSQLLDNTPGVRRVTIPIDLIFDTGLNLSVFGEAGAGKTTSLQMYARKVIEAGEKERLIVFAPLARVVKAWEKNAGPISGSIGVAAFERGIHAYLTDHSINISPVDFCALLKTKGAVFILDGVDEIIKEAPWILRAISSLSDRYKDVQIITSSRMSASYIEQIPFMGITLLPFTDKQRRRFVGQWFGSSGVSHVETIESHLERHEELSMLVRNPLLTTILCVLAENEVPLPDSEIRLYEERMRLLLGHYDVYKEVSRIHSQRSHLELLSRKLAFYLHKMHRREEDREVLYSVSEKLTGGVINAKARVLAINELVDPCNILVPMTDDGKLGFGHLRFQEYLAALEILNNRNIDILDCLDSPWWTEALIVVAQMNESLNWIIDRAVESLAVSRYAENIEAMIERGPRSRRSEYIKILRGHLKIEENYGI